MFLQGAIIGAVVALVFMIIQSAAKSNRFKNVMKSVTGKVDYAALYHYASFDRYKKKLKFFDSYGALYLIGNTVYYQTNPGAAPIEFDMTQCSIQLEPDWRMLKWFSITTPAGQKHYFNSNTMGALKANSEETPKGYLAIKARTTA